MLGKVGRPHGLRGAFFVSGREDPLPKHLKSVLIGSSPASAQEAKVKQSSMQAGRPLLVCSLADDRTGAERLTNLNIYAAASAVKSKATERDVYWTDLEGAEVYASDGKKLGVVTQIYNAGASDIATVQHDDGRSVEIALTDDYVGAELDITPGPTGRRRLNLAVPADTFDEVWDDA